MEARKNTLPLYRDPGREPAVLALADGRQYWGVAFGARGIQAGEVVFNTSMTGYQEALTDPSYRGQLLLMTYPLIGNYGVSHWVSQSATIHPRGLLVKELCGEPSHWESTGTLEDFLSTAGVIGISGLDTRALTRHLRNIGTMKGVLATGEETQRPLEDLLAQIPTQEEDWVEQVSRKEPLHRPGPGPRIAVLDLGVKKSILDLLAERGADLWVLPAKTTPQEIIDLGAKGLLLSNGPGDPQACTQAIGTARALLGQIPIFGICLGHQVLSLALGAKTYKLPYGHRGGNHPVKDLALGKVVITSQNHGYAVDTQSLPGELVLTHINLNDQTVEGFRHRTLPAFGVQYHPEAAPGPQESVYLMDQFIAMVKGGESHAQGL